MIQSTAKVSPDAKIGRNTVIEEYTIISSEVTIGDECKIHKNIFIDAGVSIGSRVKIQDGVMIPHGVSISDGVFMDLLLLLPMINTRVPLIKMEVWKQAETGMLIRHK